MRCQLIATALAACVAPAALAQEQECATVLKPETMAIIRQWEAAGMYVLPAGAAGDVYVLPITAHVVRHSDGTGGLSQARVDQAIADASDLWAQSNIQFCQYGPTRYVDDDAFYTGVEQDEEDVLRTIDVVPNTINMYFAPSTRGCGFSSFPADAIQGIVINNNCAGTPDNTSTTGHELGHYLDLYHTHETGFGVECVDGSNCGTTGDLLCDTPADPRLTGLVNTSCTYVGTANGPCPGDPPYDPNPHNIMSYSRKLCRTFFSTGQINRSRAALMNLHPELIDFGGCGLDAPCGPGAGDCYSSNGSAGCEIASCCASVCALDPFCCESTWDGICANEAFDLCLSGNECENAIPVGEGNVSGVTLVDNTGLTGDDSSCAAGDVVDEWYQYTASCSGTATAAICTEFTVVDITLSVFETCGGPELACSADHPGCSFGADLNAQVSWAVAAGTSYYVRVSAIGATPSMNFTGDLYISCSGCGSPTAGGCLVDNGTPFCSSLECCEAVCAYDPFCCNTSWDGFCAEEAADTCAACGGPGAGSCYESNGTPYCNNTACCNAVCEADPFCCNTSWDSICANEALTDCALYLAGWPHIPLGAAMLTPGAGTLIVSNIGSSGADGVALLLDGSAGAGGTPPVVSGEIGVTAGTLPSPSFIALGAVTTESVAPDQPYVELIVFSLDGAAYLLAQGQGPQTWTVRLLDGAEVLGEAFNVDGSVIAQATPPTAPDFLSATVVGGELTLSARWDQQHQIAIPGVGPFAAREVVVSTETNSSPDDSGVGTLTRLHVLGANVGSFVIGNETINACPWDCAQPPDGQVNVVDFLALIATFGQAGVPCDIDGGGVSITDFLAFLANFGPCP
jgi:hypothetical protein